MLAAEGREVWQLQANGQLANAATQLCAGLAADDPGQGGRVALMDCDAALKTNDGRSQWEMLGSGQWKLAAGSDLCLSQSGAAPGLVNAAARMAARASSTASPSHGVMTSARGAVGPARVVSGVRAGRAPRRGGEWGRRGVRHPGLAFGRCGGRPGQPVLGAPRVP